MKSKNPILRFKSNDIPSCLFATARTTRSNGPIWSR